MHMLCTCLRYMFSKLLVCILCLVDVEFQNFHRIPHLHLLTYERLYPYILNIKFVERVNE